MKFKTVKDLIDYLAEFNPNAEVLTDMSFSWVKPQLQESSEEDKKTTNILYVYGEYNPYYEENQNYYRIKDFLIDAYFNKYDDLVSCYLFFEDDEGNPAVEYYLKHKNYWSFDQSNLVRREILEGTYNFCKENDMIEEFRNISLFLTQEVFD